MVLARTISHGIVKTVWQNTYSRTSTKKSFLSCFLDFSRPLVSLVCDWFSCDPIIAYFPYSVAKGSCHGQSKKSAIFDHIGLVRVLGSQPSHFVLVVASLVDR